LEGLRIIGDPQLYARKYYEQGADELIYIDIVASLYGRSNLAEIVGRTAQDVFIPMTVGGGVRSIDDVQTLLRAGADKVAINTAAVGNPDLIQKVSRRFGSQCMVLSIEAKRRGETKWEVYTDNGRERSRVDAVEWAQRGVGLGAGEVLVTSIDQEGTRKGYDTGLVRQISDAVSVPVIASGGMGVLEHALDVVRDAHADAIAMADVLHYDRLTIPQIRSAMHDAGYHVRHL
jgi:cyclase